VTIRRLYYNSTIDQLPLVTFRRIINTGVISSTIYKLVEMWVNPVDENVYSRQDDTTSINDSTKCPSTSCRFDELLLRRVAAPPENALTYYHMATITAVKSFIVEAPVNELMIKCTFLLMKR